MESTRLPESSQITSITCRLSPSVSLTISMVLMELILIRIKIDFYRAFLGGSSTFSSPRRPPLFLHLPRQIPRSFH